jgi:hypothetical protein
MLLWASVPGRCTLTLNPVQLNDKTAAWCDLMQLLLPTDIC